MQLTDAWQSDQHPRQFGRAIRSQNKYLFLLRFRRYLPARCLNFLLNTTALDTPSLIDIGCAAGDFYAYMMSLTEFDSQQYQGLDVSKPAIEFANKNYKTDVFSLIHGDADLADKSADIVLSVDVVPHQEEPFDHLVSIFLMRHDV